MLYILLLFLSIMTIVLLWTRRYDNYQQVYPVQYLEYPYWSSPLRSTRGMSYDLRGDVPIGNMMVTPFNMTTRSPIMNKPLYMVS